MRARPAAVHIADIQTDPASSRTQRDCAARWATARSAVPLLREGGPSARSPSAAREVRPFTDKEIALLKTFADQAVIAIENVRLFKGAAGAHK